MLEILKTALAKSCGASLLAVLAYGALALLVVLIAAPFYLALRRHVSVRFDLRVRDTSRDASGDTLRLHDAPALDPKIEVEVETSAQTFKLDDAALDRVAQHVSAGRTIDEACALVVPRYPSMPGMMQGILRTAMKAALATRSRR